MMTITTSEWCCYDLHKEVDYSEGNLCCVDLTLSSKSYRIPAARLLYMQLFNYVEQLFSKCKLQEICTLWLHNEMDWDFGRLIVRSILNPVLYIILVTRNTCCCTLTTFLSSWSWGFLWSNIQTFYINMLTLSYKSSHYFIEWYHIMIYNKYFIIFID